MDNVPFQYEFRPELPNVYGTVDYREFREVHHQDGRNPH